MPHDCYCILLNPAERDPDFAVVGGGLVGWAMAFGLARAGRRVAVVDEGDFALRASRGNFGQVWVQDKGPGVPAYQRLTRDSARQWKDLERDLAGITGIVTGLQQPGGLAFCFDEAALEARTRLMRRMQAEAGDFGFEFEMLTRGELDRRVPGLGPKVIGASYTPYDGHVNPLRLLRALYQASIKLGVRYLPGAAVDSIDAARGGFTLHSAGGRVQAGNILLAAGLGNHTLAPMVGVDCPVRPVRGQILVTEKVQPVLHYPSTDLRQTDEGGLLLGSSQEDAGLDDGVTTRNAAAIARRAVDTFPFIAGLRIVRSWAALRVMTPDGLPVYAASEAFPGAYVVSCHSGVTLAAAHVFDVAPGIACGGLPANLSYCSASRFGASVRASGVPASGVPTPPSPQKPGAREAHVSQSA